MWLLRTQTKGEERPDSTPRCLGKEHPFSIPLDTGSLMVGEMLPKEVERGRKEGRSALGVGGSWACCHVLRGTRAERGSHRQST